MLATGSSDGMISVLTHGADDSWETALLEGHKGGVTAVSWGPSTSPTLIQVIATHDLAIESEQRNLRTRTHALRFRRLRPHRQILDLQ